jgi:hypothetical protein
VVEQDRLNNYILKDTEGKTVNAKFPLSQIKKISTDDRATAIVQKILNHKRDLGKTSFFVKWQGLPKTHNSWVDESDFKSKEIIQKYFSKNPQKQIIDPVRTSARVRRRQHGMSQLAYVLSIIFFLMVMFTDEITATEDSKPIDMFSLGFYDRVKWEYSRTNLPFCLTPIKKWPVNLNNICTSSFPPDENQRANNFRLAIEKDKHRITRTKLEDGHYDKVAAIDVYTKEVNEVVGTGYQCYSTMITYTFSESFFGHPIDQYHETIVHLQPSECSKMVHSKECGPERMKMLCEGLGCFYREEIIPEYNWFFDVKKIHRSCKFVEIKFTAEHSDSQVFGDNCKANELSCRLHDSIIIWSQKLIHQCPFKRILHQTPFDINRDGFTSISHNVNFIFHKNEPNCGKTLLKMAEGVYIMFSSPEADEFFKATGQNDNGSVPDLKRIVELTMASLDFVSKEEGTFQREAYELSCKIFSNTLHLLSTTTNDEFVKINDHRNNEIILFISKGFIYKPICSKVDNIRFQKEADECSRNLKVEFNKDGEYEFHNAELTSKGILIRPTRTTPNTTTCMKLRQIFPCNSKTVIVKEGKSVKLLNISYIKEQEELHFANFESMKSRNHSDLLREEFNFQKLMMPNVMSNDVQTDSTYDLYKQEARKIKSKLIDYVTYACKTVLWISLIFFILLMIIVVTFFTIKYKYYLYLLKYVKKCLPKDEIPNDPERNENLWKEVKKQIELKQIETNNLNEMS